MPREGEKPAAGRKDAPKAPFAPPQQWRSSHRRKRTDDVMAYALENERKRQEAEAKAKEDALAKAKADAEGAAAAGANSESTDVVQPDGSAAIASDPAPEISAPPPAKKRADAAPRPLRLFGASVARLRAVLGEEDQIVEGDVQAPPAASASAPAAEGVPASEADAPAASTTVVISAKAAKPAKGPATAHALGMVATVPIGATGAEPDAATDAASWGLHPHVVSVLTSKMRVARFFPVQRELIPLLLRADAACDPTVGDVAVSAPTGSGKTLTYAVPILHALLASPSAGGPRTRALVLLPTRDLVSQVAAVFREFTAGTRLTVLASTGAASLASEQAALVSPGGSSHHHTPLGGLPPTPVADILICTPGRLVEHLDVTPGFRASLGGLSYVVIDEADRLLAEAYQDWPARLHEAIFAGTGGGAMEDGVEAGEGAVSAARIAPLTRRVHVGESSRVGYATSSSSAPVAAAGSAGAIVAAPPGTRAPHWLAAAKLASASSSNAHAASAPLAAPPLRAPFRKIVCSATLTANPRKLAALRLRTPMHFTLTAAASAATHAAAAAAGIEAPGAAHGGDSDKAYALPPTVRHAWAVVGAGDKPAALLHTLRLLAARADSAISGASDSARGNGLLALVFTSSVETASRLAAFLNLAGSLPRPAAEFSASLPQAQRSAVLQAAASGGLSVLVASDVAARGLDLPFLPAVVQYDPPSRAKAYVHRAGRTGRAGRAGLSITLVRPEQARHFSRMAAKVPAGHAVAKETLTAGLLSGYAPRVDASLRALSAALEGTNGGVDLSALPPLPEVEWDDYTGKKKVKATVVALDSGDSSDSDSSDSDSDSEAEAEAAARKRAAAAASALLGGGDDDGDDSSSSDSDSDGDVAPSRTAAPKAAAAARPEAAVARRAGAGDSDSSDSDDSSGSDSEAPPQKKAKVTSAAAASKSVAAAKPAAPSGDSDDSDDSSDESSDSG